MVVKSKICNSFVRIIRVKKNKNGSKPKVLSHFYGADDRGVNRYGNRFPRDFKKKLAMIKVAL